MKYISTTSYIIYGDKETLETLLSAIQCAEKLCAVDDNSNFMSVLFKELGFMEGTKRFMLTGKGIDWNCYYKTSQGLQQHYDTENDLMNYSLAIQEYAEFDKSENIDIINQLFGNPFCCIYYRTCNDYYASTNNRSVFPEKWYLRSRKLDIDRFFMAEDEMLDYFRSLPFYQADKVKVINDIYERCERMGAECLVVDVEFNTGLRSNADYSRTNRDDSHTIENSRMCHFDSMDNEQASVVQYIDYCSTNDMSSLRASAENGFILAQRELARRLLYTNEQESYEWYIKAAQVGDADALLTIGQAYMALHDRTEEDTTKGTELLLKAANKGKLGAWDVLLSKVPDTDSHYNEYLQKAAEAGCYRAISELASKAYDSEDYVTARKWLEIYGGASRRLCRIYAFGLGDTAVDYKKAIIADNPTDNQEFFDVIAKAGKEVPESLLKQWALSLAGNKNV